MVSFLHASTAFPKAFVCVPLGRFPRVLRSGDVSIMFMYHIGKSRSARNIQLSMIYATNDRTLRANMWRAPPAAGGVWCACGTVFRVTKV